MFVEVFCICASFLYLCKFFVFVEVFCDLWKWFVICGIASFLWKCFVFVEVFCVCGAYVFVEVFCICASVLYLCKCFVPMSHRTKSSY